MKCINGNSSRAGGYKWRKATSTFTSTSSKRARISQEETNEAHDRSTSLPMISVIDSMVSSIDTAVSTLLPSFASIFTAKQVRTVGESQRGSVAAVAAAAVVVVVPFLM